VFSTWFGLKGGLAKAQFRRARPSADSSTATVLFGTAFASSFRVGCDDPLDRRGRNLHRTWHFSRVDPEIRKGDLVVTDEGTVELNGYCVRRCLLCGDAGIDAKVDGRVVTTSCRACHAVLIIEFDPPDEPTLRARIERIDDAMDAEVLESDPDRQTARRYGNRNSPIVLVASRRR
jgi:hypothetical protein